MNLISGLSGATDVSYYLNFIRLLISVFDRYISKLFRMLSFDNLYFQS